MTAKRTVVVAVSDLPLKGIQQRHTFKLLAGPRWTPTPPADAGIGPDESHSAEGFIKISCEDFPQPGMNLKWISDVLDRLVEEANVSSFVRLRAHVMPIFCLQSEDVCKAYANIPLDTRHIESKKGKRKNATNFASFKDFPSEWLPPPKVSPQ